MSILIGKDTEEERFRRFTRDLNLIVDTYKRDDDWALKKVMTPFAEESEYARIIRGIYQTVIDSNIPEIVRRIDDLLKDENHAISELSELLELNERCMHYARLVHEAMHDIYCIEHHQEKQHELPETIRKMNSEQAISDICLLLSKPMNRDNVELGIKEMERIRNTYLYDIAPRIEIREVPRREPRPYKA